MRHDIGAVLLLVISSLGCADHPGSHVYVLTARGGTYEDGSGRVGLAVLATVRDTSGAGPAGSLPVALLDGAAEVGTATYAGASAGSFSAWTFPAVPPATGQYAVSIATEGASLRTDVDADPALRLAVPVPELAPDGAVVSWASIPGAASYGCVARDTAGAVAISYPGAPSCTMTGLAPPITVETLAYSADLPTLAAAAEVSPALPPRFDVSAARVGVGRGNAGEPLLFRAAGGRIDYGLAEPGLALWLSIVAPDGAGPTDTWDLRITGPGLPNSAPLLTVYPSGFPRIALWSYAVLPDRGAYRVDATARGGSGALAVVFVIGEPEILEAPTGVTAAGAAQGGADVTWNAVPGALAYFASIYTHPTQQDPISHFVSGQWSSGAAAAFPPGTIAPGGTYDAYVTASSADVASGSTVPTRISASENAYAPVAFVGM